MGDWAVFGGFLMVASLVGWLVIRDLARRDRDPEVEKRWPEWWEDTPPEDRGHPVLDERLGRLVSRILSWTAAPPAHAPGLARAASSFAS